MSASAFSRYAFSRSLKAGDSTRFGVELKVAKDAAINAAIACSRAPVHMLDYNEIMTGGKACVSYSDYSMTLVLRALANNLRYRGKVNMPNRDQIVRGVRQAISEATPMAIHRRDITSFYESVPLVELKQELLDSALLSPQARSVLKTFFDIHCFNSSVGVPRGLPVSAVLAELVMRTCDEQIRSHPGVYRYYRFSDDILIFSYDHKLDIDAVLNSILPVELKLNSRKHRSIVLSGADVHTYPYKSFEYLGYDFHLSNGPIEKGLPRPISICIAQSKIKKIKSRIILSAKKLAADRDALLFIDRIHFLTGNYRVARSRINVRTPKRRVKSGIYFNYRYCVESADRLLPSNAVALKELDGFLYSLLWSPRSEFRRVIDQELSVVKKEKLRRSGFFKGFDHALMRHFRPDRIRQIKAAWAYVR